jgi:hypothetical protein
MKIVYRTNLIVIAYLIIAWFVGRLSWPLFGGVLVYWFLLPFAVVWSRPEHRQTPLWGRTIVSAFFVAIAAGLAIAALAY